MAQYTIELRHIVESGRNIFNFNYPFYDEKARLKFEEDFIRHFYFREIGVDTVDKFVFFLEDKMHTVFPYYNELFNTAQIKYSVLDNYNITEKTTLKRDNVGQSSGISSSVGQTFDERTTENNEEQNTTKSENATTTGTNNGTSNKSVNATTTEEGETSNTLNATEDVENSHTSKEEMNASTSENGTETHESQQSETRKFLDTPQGAVNLDDTKYLTTLNQDSGNKNGTDTAEKERTENSTNDKTDNGTASKDTNQTENGTSAKETTHTETESGETSNNSEDKTELSGSEQNLTTGNVHSTGEQKVTADNNTRTRSEGSTTETTEFTRRGNIGIDTDADMIQKHIKLQQVLTKIKLMFFDECEDLFMGVY